MGSSFRRTRTSTSRRPKRRTFFLTFVIAVAVTAVGVTELAGASRSANPPVRTVNFGAGKIKVGGAPLKIAFLTAASVNAYSVAYNQSAVAEAKKLGVKLTVFDANLDALKQVNQAKTAIVQGYNAIVMTALSAEMCTITKQAVKKGILVSINNQHVCTSVYANGSAIWVPGTVNFIGGDQTGTLFTKFLMTVAAKNPGPQQVALVEGTPNLAQSLLATKAANAVHAKYPNFNVTTIQDPTYDITGAYTKVQSFLPAHSNLTILATVYSDMTQGAVKALQQAKYTKVKVYDMGGSTWAFGAVKSGAIQLTSVFLPRTEARLAVKSLYTAWYTGKAGPHYVDILKSVSDPFVTKQNIAGRHAEY